MIAKHRHQKPRVFPSDAPPPGGPRAKAVGGQSNQLRLGANPDNYQAQAIAWHLGGIDYEGPYCFSSIDQGQIKDVIDKLRSFESMKWSEILGSKNHAIATESLSKPARDRLTTLQLDDVGELVSLRFSGRERVFGVRQGAVLRLLWWDPNHEVCPSILKHT